MKNRVNDIRLMLKAKEMAKGVSDEKKIINSLAILKQETARRQYKGKKAKGRLRGLL